MPVAVDEKLEALANFKMPRGVTIETVEQADMNDRDLMVVNMGPQHPSTHGVLRLVVELDGETVTNVVPHIGYLHTGIEKTMENLTYYKALVCTDREDYLSNLINNLAYCLAVEKLLDIEIPLRAQRMRVILNELERLASHLIWLGTHGLDIGAMTIFFYAWRERDAILDLKEMISGVRMMTSWICPGGLRGDAPLGWFERVQKFVDMFPKKLDEYNALLTKNPIWIERLTNIGIISAEDAVAYGMSGPSLRGSGVAWDLRKSNPYSVYEQYDLDIAFGTHGDVYDRFLCRME
jgi:NADH-quinone oxidoreductase subunit D